jgi:glycosyltransferase involved in cell wall biosynthesis
MSEKLRVLHIINSLEAGGAEAMLCNLVLRMDRQRYDVSVASLIDNLNVAGPLLEAGVAISTMGMKPGAPDPRGLWRLVRHLRRVRPAVVQTWMDHSNLIGGLAARLACDARVVWGIHHSEHVPGVAKWSTLATVWGCARLSRRVPSRIVCCSEHSRTLYGKRGFADERMAVIPNGFDTARFRPDAAARLSVRRELGIDDHAPVVGLVARYDPLKDHGTFFRAAKLLADKLPAVHFVLCGTRVDAANVELAEQVRAAGVGPRCHLLGLRRDVPRVTAAFDVATSASISEAFPLAVGEAMACGVVCAVTDVGDSARIVGPTGRVVRPRDAEGLAAAWRELLAAGPNERARVSAAARQRICEQFNLGAVTRRYEQLYDEVAARVRVRSRSEPPCVYGPVCYCGRSPSPRPDARRPGSRPAAS